MRRFSIVLFWGGSLSLAAVLLLASIGIRFNSSVSLPVGFYRWSGATGELKRGDIIIFCPEEVFTVLALERGYLKRGPCPFGSAPLGKPVLGAVGDTIRVDSSGVFLNGTLITGSKPLEKDSQGRPLPVLNALGSNFMLGAGEYFVLSARVPGSFDSRYYGPVGTDQIIARAKPIW